MSLDNKSALYSLKGSEMIGAIALTEKYREKWRDQIVAKYNGEENVPDYNSFEYYLCYEVERQYQRKCWQLERQLRDEQIRSATLKLERNAMLIVSAILLALTLFFAL